MGLPAARSYILIRTVKRGGDDLRVRGLGDDGGDCGFVA